MYIELKNWRLTKKEPGNGRTYMLEGVWFGIPVRIRNIRNVEYIRVGIIAHWGCIGFLCIYGQGGKIIDS